MSAFIRSERIKILMRAFSCLPLPREGAGGAARGSAPPGAQTGGDTPILGTWTSPISQAGRILVKQSSKLQGLKVAGSPHTSSTWGGAETPGQPAWAAGASPSRWFLATSRRGCLWKALQRGTTRPSVQAASFLFVLELCKSSNCPVL